MKKIIFALLSLLILLVPISEAVIFRTAAVDGPTFAVGGQLTFIPSTITLTPAAGGASVTQSGAAPAYAVNFNVNFNTVYDVNYVSPGYTADTDDFYLDSQLQSCALGNNCNIASNSFSTSCRWNATFNDWTCRVTDTATNQWYSYIYNRNDPLYGEVVRSLNAMYPFVPSNQDPVLNPVGSKIVNEGQLLTFVVSGSDLNNDPLTFDTGNIAPLPSGAAFSQATATFSWTPNFNQAGAYQVTFYVRDPFGAYDSEQITITVADVPGVPGGPGVPGNLAPVFRTSPVTSAVPNEIYAYDADAFDPEGAILTYTLATAPTNMTINPATGLVKWTPSISQLGNHNVVISVTDGVNTVQQGYTLKVGFGISGIARKILKLTRISAQGECYTPGSDVPILASADNKADAGLREVKLTASIPELGIRKQVGPFDLKKGKGATKELMLEIPSDVPSGEYHVRVVMSNDDVRRVRERPIIIANGC